MKVMNDPEIQMTEILNIHNSLRGEPGSWPVRVGLLQAAGMFSIAAAIRDLTGALRQKNSKPPKEPSRG